MEHPTKTKLQRAKLGVRNEPYWTKLRSGFSLGYRKTKSLETDSWSARLVVGGKYEFTKVGDGYVEYDSALDQAEEWRAKTLRQGTSKTDTIKEACISYLGTLTGSTYDFTEGVLKRSVYNHRIAKIKLADLRPQDVIKWRDGLLTDKRGVELANRMLTVLKGALNLAHKELRVANSDAWSGVGRLKPHHDKRKDPKNHERVYLTIEERRSFIEASPEDLADLIRASLYTAGRPGELARARVQDFDPAQRNLRLTTTKGSQGKERERFVPLPPDSVEFFERMAEGKLPKAYLLTDNKGRQWDRHHWNQLLKSTVRPNCELPANKVRLHNLRHCVITDWLVAGMELMQVCKIAGTSVKMIEEHYAKYIKTHVEDVLLKVQSF